MLNFKQQETESNTPQHNAELAGTRADKIMFDAYETVFLHFVAYLCETLVHMS
jgi:hypothetical protein